MRNTLPKRIQSQALRLLSSAKVHPFSARNWRGIAGIPKRPGVYAIWGLRAYRRPVYVGETANLYERMKDLASWQNHTFTRKIKKRHRFRRPSQAREFIRDHYRVTFIPVSFGRKEIEEHLVQHWRTDRGENFNDPTPRRWRSDA